MFNSNRDIEKLKMTLETRASLYRDCVTDFGLNTYDFSTTCLEEQSFKGTFLMVCHSDAALGLKNNNLYATLLTISGDMRLTSYSGGDNGNVRCVDCKFTLYSHTESGILETGSFYRSEGSQKNLIFIIQQQNLFLMKKPEDRKIIDLLS